MINTFICEGFSNSDYDALEKCLLNVNRVIEENDISRGNIIEYVTRHYEKEINGTSFYTYEVTMTFWKIVI